MGVGIAAGIAIGNVAAGASVLAGAAKAYTFGSAAIGMVNASVNIYNNKGVGVGDALAFVPLVSFGIGKLASKVGAASSSSGKAFTVDPRVVKQLSDPRLGEFAGNISPSRLHGLVNSSTASHFFDTRTGNINIIQELGDKLLRITVAGDKFKIISIGPIQARNVANSVLHGNFVPIGFLP